MRVVVSVNNSLTKETLGHSGASKKGHLFREKEGSEVTRLTQMCEPSPEYIIMVGEGNVEVKWGNAIYEWLKKGRFVVCRFERKSKASP